MRFFRWAYRKAMFRAMNHACNKGWDEIYANRAPLKYGLYVIRTFEKQREFTFNPFNPRHVRMVRGNRMLAIIHFLRRDVHALRQSLKVG
jgi:hypothetical protein